MVKLKNPRPVRLMDHGGRFDLKPGDEIEFESVPKDLMGLIKKGYLKEVKSSSSGSEKGKKVSPDTKGSDSADKKPESSSSVSASSTANPSTNSGTGGKKDSKPSTPAKGK